MNDISKSPESTTPTPEVATIVDRVFDVGTSWVAGVLEATRRTLETGATRLHVAAERVGTLAGELAATTRPENENGASDKAA